MSTMTAKNVCLFIFSPKKNCCNKKEEDKTDLVTPF